MKIGITGGIGSGKTTVTKIFEVLGVPVYYADDAAKRLMNTNPGLQQKIKQHFGDEMYTGTELNRKLLADIVFADPEKLTLLNSLVHPATLKDADDWMQRQTTPYTLKEAALIFESGAQQNLDYVIGITAPTPLRIQRTMHRDGITREDIIARMDKQLDDVIKMRLCDFVIKNDEQQMLLPQVITLHEKLLMLSQNK